MRDIFFPTKKAQNLKCFPNFRIKNNNFGATKDRDIKTKKIIRVVAFSNSINTV